MRRMITKLGLVCAGGTNPYENIALEEYLLQNVEKGECILYLWQNQKTVVIGRNQNAYRECLPGKLEEDGGFLARRLSGGGAVYHDLGNLNVTFLARAEDFSVERQTDVILEAVRDCGISAERNGRNDLVAGGRKFSGHAFFRSGGKCCQHGTILVCSDMAAMSGYLKVSPEKLKSKGVESVRSRVGNLAEACPGLAVEEVGSRLVESFCRIYGGEAVSLNPDPGAYAERIRFFSSWEWNYGRKIPFTCRVEGRFPWGGVELQLEVNEGAIKNAVFYSDGLDPDFLEVLEQAVRGLRFEQSAISGRFAQIGTEDTGRRQMKQDLERLLAGEVFHGTAGEGETEGGEITAGEGKWQAERKWKAER